MENVFRPPQSIEAEQAVISAIIANNKTLEKVEEFLCPEHFSDPFYGKVFKTAKELISRGRLADPIMLKAALAADLGDQSDDLDGTLNRMAVLGLSIVNIADYGRIIFDRYLRRELINLGQEVVADAVRIDMENPALEQIETVEKKLYDLGATGEIDGGPKELAGSFAEVLSSIERARKSPDGISGVATGLTDLDRMMGGFHDSDLIVLAGRPAMGKTALATCIAVNIAREFHKENMKPGVKEKKAVAFFSLEMSAPQLSARILSSEAGVNSHKMRTGQIDVSDFEILRTAGNNLKSLPFYIDDTAGLTINSIRTRARRFKRSSDKGLGLIVLDYLQLVGGTGKYSENRVLELSEITRQLKIMAKDLNVPILALSQLSRKVEDREDKVPQLADLRESGSIEQDADIVMFVYREEYYLEKKKIIQNDKEFDAKFLERQAKHERSKVEAENKADVVVAKQRHGPTGTITLHFDKALTKFYDLVKEEYLPQQAL